VPPKKLTPAGDAILAAGYPLQTHTVVTSDGYILEMERIPRPGGATFQPSELLSWKLRRSSGRVGAP